MEERGLDHLVIASCSPRFQGPTFERIARDLGLGENAVAFANVREGCSFVHRDQPELAQEKAKSIVGGAVARVRQHERPAAPPHLPASLAHGRRRWHRRHDRRRGAGGERHRGAPRRAPAVARRVHGTAQQDLPDRRLRHVLRWPRGSRAPRSRAASTSTRSPTWTRSAGLPGEFRVMLRHRPRYVSEACVGCGECAAVCPVHVPERVRVRRRRPHRDLATVLRRRARHVRRREEGLEPVQERLRRAHLRPGLRGAGRRRPPRGGVPGGERAQPVPQRLRPHLHPSLRVRLRPRLRRRACRHRRAQALRRRHRGRRRCRWPRRRSSTRSRSP